MNYNRTILGGRLTRDPESRFLNNGTAVVSFGLAVNEKIDKERERVLFVDVTMFGKRGEAFARFHKKGDAAFVEGGLRLDTWDDKKTGQKRNKLYVVGDRWEFSGERKKDGAAAGAEQPDEDSYDPFAEYDKAHPKAKAAPESDDDVDDAPF